MAKRQKKGPTHKEAALSVDIKLSNTEGDAEVEPCVPPAEGGGGDYLQDGDPGRIERYKGNLLGRVPVEVQS